MLKLEKKKKKKKKKRKKEMYYLNYHNALWDCFGFPIVQISNMLLNQAMLPDGVIDPDWLILYSGCMDFRWSDPVTRIFVFTCTVFFFFFFKYMPNLSHLQNEHDITAYSC